ncbi:late competence protein ComER [Marinicrinis lubricantis]|uniref:Pyrroline-5-carboxylate reductase n=1 Tax=Marinicrinis lubricantis TaxID=2086470 RepID=A0ABW1IUX4_9BACL
MNIGFIGTGSMGTILIESFIKTGAIKQENINIHNRSKEKAELLQIKYPGIHIAENCQQLAAGSDLIMICVKPLEYKNVLEQMSCSLTKEHIIVSITSPVLIKHLEYQTPCKIAKVIPSVTNFACSGASLCIFGERMEPDDRTYVHQLFSAISTPIEIQEEYTRVTSDISSCGPAFISYFLLQFVQAAVDVTGISKEHATKLASEMLLGTGKLLTSGNFTPETLIQKVSVPGGITAEGIRYMSLQLDGVFNQLIHTTHTKYNEDLEKVEAMVGTKVD